MVEASEAVQPGDSGPGILDAGSLVLPVATLFRGYCADCGTWDDHGATCKTCGYAFTGAPVWDEPDLD